MDEVAESDACDVAVSAEHNNLEVWTHQFDTYRHWYASSMRSVDGISLKVWRWNPCGAAYSAAENEFSKVFVT
jgi:hypothetical protein